MIILVTTLTPGNAIIALTFASYVLQPLYPECEPPLGAVRLLAASLVCKPARGRGGWRPC